MKLRQTPDSEAPKKGGSKSLIAKSLALAMLLGGAANAQELPKPASLDGKTQDHPGMTVNLNQRDETKEKARGGYFILPSLNLLVPYDDASDYDITYPFDPQGAPILPPGAEIDLPEVVSLLPYTAIDQPIINANFFIRKGDTPHIVRLWDAPVRNIDGNYQEIAPGVIEVSWNTRIRVDIEDGWSRYMITFNGIGVPQEEINWSLNDLTPTDTLYLNKSGIDLAHFPWTNTAFGNTRKIWIIQGEGDETNRGHGVAFDRKDQGRLFWNEVTRIPSGFTTVEEFYENYIATNPRVFNNPSRQETKTIGNQTYTISHYRVTRLTGDWWSTGPANVLSDVITIAVVDKVETINTQVTPSVNRENWSGTVSFSDGTTSYTSWESLPTWVSYEINIVPDEGTVIEDVIVNGVHYWATSTIANIEFTAASEQNPNPDNSVRIVCVNQNPTHSINVLNWENGTTEILDAQGNPIEDLAQVPNGAEIQVLARSDEGYRTTKIKINGVEHSNPQHLNPFIVDAVVNSDMTIEVFRELETSSLGILGSEVKIWKAPNGFTIMPEGEWISNLSVHSIEGKLVNAMSQISGNDAVYIPISQPGVYVVSFMVKGKREIRKVVIQ